MGEVMVTGSRHVHEEQAGPGTPAGDYLPGFEAWGGGVVEEPGAEGDAAGAIRSRASLISRPFARGHSGSTLLQ